MERGSSTAHKVQDAQKESLNVFDTMSAEIIFF